MNIGVETEKIEFKKTTVELQEGITSLASMLNKNGYGILYFGVKDNGDVVGQQMGDRTLREISQAIANFIKPQIIPTIEHKLIDDKNVIKIEVRGSEKPYSATDGIICVQQTNQVGNLIYNFLTLVTAFWNF